MFLIILLISCHNDFKKKDYAVNIFNIKSNDIRKLQKKLSYPNGFELKKINNRYTLINLSKDNKILFFNLNSGSSESFSFRELKDLSTIDAVRYDTNSITIIAGGILFHKDFNDSAEDYFCKTPLGADEYIIHNVYSPNLRKFNDYYFIQYGENNTYNYIDTTCLIFFNCKDFTKKFYYPKNYFTHYIQYTDLCIDNRLNDFFYIPTTGDTLFKANFETNAESKVALHQSGYLLFDTTRLRDMKYISDYTEQTTYNIKLLCSNKYLFLIQQYYNNNAPKFRMFVFNYNLELVESFNIDHNVEKSFIFFLEPYLLFVDIKENRLYEYTFK